MCGYTECFRAFYGGVDVCRSDNSSDTGRPAGADLHLMRACLWENLVAQQLRRLQGIGCFSYSVCVLMKGKHRHEWNCVSDFQKLLEFEIRRWQRGAISQSY